MSEYSQLELLEMIADAMRLRHNWWRNFEVLSHCNNWIVATGPTSLMDTVLAYPELVRPAPRRRYAYLPDGTEVSWPEPVREPLNNGQKYYIPNINHPEGCDPRCWYDYGNNYLHIKTGKVHLTPKAAREHRDAEIILAGGTPPGGENE